MKMIMAFVMVGFLSATASYAQVGPKDKTDCKEILKDVRALKAAGSAGGGGTPPAEGAAEKKSDAK